MLRKKRGRRSSAAGHTRKLAPRPGGGEPRRPASATTFSLAANRRGGGLEENNHPGFRMDPVRLPAPAPGTFDLQDRAFLIPRTRPLRGAPARRRQLAAPAAHAQRHFPPPTASAQRRAGAAASLCSAGCRTMARTKARLLLPPPPPAEPAPKMEAAGSAGSLSAARPRHGLLALEIRGLFSERALNTVQAAPPALPQHPKGLPGFPCSSAPQTQQPHCLRPPTKPPNCHSTFSR